MAVLTFGADSTNEVESYLGLRDSIDTGSQDGVKLNILIKSIEGWLKLATGRNFEEKTYTKEIHDVEPFQSVIFLRQTPLSGDNR